MVVYRLILSYLGTPFAGWQRQPNAPSVQAALEGALQELLGRPVRTVAASRTDSGVHARGQAVHLELERPFPCGGLVHGTNHHLPPAVRVLAADRMRDGFHARKAAASKEYSYRLSRRRVLSPLDAPYAVRVEPDLDPVALCAAARVLVGEHDFSAFARAGGSHRQSRRRILAAAWEERGEELLFTVRGDGFLRGMVRALVGTQLEIGRGRRSLENLAILLEGQPRAEAGPTAPARGLVLERVLYAAEWGPLADEPARWDEPV